MLLMGRIVYEKIKNKKWFKKLAHHFNQHTDDLFEEKVLVIFYLLAKVIFIFLGLVLVFFYISSASMAMGKDNAQTYYEKMKRGDVPPVKIKITDEPVQLAHTIHCSSSHCAFLVKNTVLTYALNDIGYIKSTINP